jgi:hypothetical protein
MKQLFLTLFALLELFFGLVVVAMGNIESQPDAGTLQYTRYYLGGCYEKDVPASGNTTERLYIGGSSAYNAPAVYIRTGSGAWTLHYFAHK